MNTRTTFIVLLIAVALATYFIVFELKPGDGDSADPATPTVDKAGSPLFEDAVDSTKISKLTITQAGGQPIVFERDSADGNSWRQTQPVAWPAKEWKLDGIADAVAALRYTRRLQADADPATYGLSPAAKTVGVVGDGFAHTIALGRESTAGKAFVMIDDEKSVYVVDDDLHDATEPFTPEDYRSTTLAAMNADKATTVTLIRDGKTITLARSKGRWAFDVGATGRVDDEAVESLVGTMTFANIESFVADNPADLAAYGLDEPGSTLTVTADEVTQTLRIGNARDLAGDQFFAMLNDVPMVFVLAKELVDRLNKTVDGLRDPRITNVARSDVREITLQRADADDLHFVLSEGVWSLEGAPFAVELGVVSDLIDQLVNAKAADYREAFADNIVATVRLAVAGEPEDEVIRIARGGEAGELLVRRGDESVTYVVNATALTRVFSDRLAFRDRTVIDVAPSEVVAITIDGPGDSTRTIKRDQSGNWELAGLDTQTFESLLARVSRLRAKTWITTKPHVNEMIITLKLNTGEEQTLRLATEALLGWTDAGMFELHAAVMDALTADLRDRTVIKLSVDQINAITIGDVTIERYDGTRYRRADGEMIDEEQAGQLFDQIAGLRAEAYTFVALTDPSLRLTVKSGEKAMTLSLALPKTAEAGVATARVDDGPTFTLNPNVAAAISRLVAGLQHPK
jgi:hypothetical protein